MAHPTTGTLIARVAAIAGLALLGAAALRLLARWFEPLTLIGLTLPVTAVACVPFMVVAIVQLIRWRKRTQTTGVQVTLRQRVLWLSVTWTALTLAAMVLVAVLTVVLAISLNVTTDGTLLLTVVVVGPMLLLGVGATAVVESAYERKFAATAAAG